MNNLSIIFVAILSLEVVVILFLSLTPYCGTIGQDIVDTFTKAPGLDLLLSVMVWIPWLISSAIAGIIGIVTAIIAQITVMQLWIFYHELLHRDAVSGSRIVRFWNQKIGWWRNQLALWSTTIALPAFFLIRFSQITVYPILIWLLGFPKYNHSEWVNVSRHKFSGLVGHDLIWCLYCDWMTGLYSLGAEMLRNLESFWCPIRFYDGKKCDNCKLDFPDIEGGWVATDVTMDDVEQLLKQKYGNHERSWFGHPVRQQQ